MSASRLQESCTDEKLTKQHEEIDALLIELAELSQPCSQTGEMIDDSPLVPLKQPLAGGSITGSNNELIEWGKKYEEAVIIRKNYQQRNTELNNERNKLVRSVEGLRKEYKEVTGKHDDDCNHQCNCYEKIFKARKRAN